MQYNEKFIVKFLNFINKNINSNTPKKFTENLFIENFNKLDNKKLVKIFIYLSENELIEGVNITEFDQGGGRLYFYNLELTEKGIIFLINNSFPKKLSKYSIKIFTLLSSIIAIIGGVFAILANYDQAIEKIKALFF